MYVTEYQSELSRRVREFVLQGFTPHYGELTETQPSHELWQALRATGTELWLDTGNIEDVDGLWTREFSALTTNNSLLNKEIQSGQYDGFIAEAGRLLDEFDLTERERKLELAFILNARHALRLVERYDAFVSVEEHTDLTHDLDGAINYARRYFAICPERFYVKIPFSAAGLLATRQVSKEGIRVNHTLGFSARQNYLIARVGRPAFVNVFMGRLNSFVADNGLGDGSYVGEKATLASQQAVAALRVGHNQETRQIGASYREGKQVQDLAGIDVMTLPAKVARGFLEMELSPTEISNRTEEDYTPGINDDVDPDAVGLDTLWEVPEGYKEIVEELEESDPGSMTPDALIEFFADHGHADAMVRWTDKQITTALQEGKIPYLETWRSLLAGREIGLDSLMNLAGWAHFHTDQQKMDQHVQQVLEKVRR